MNRLPANLCRLEQRPSAIRLRPRRMVLPRCNLLPWQLYLLIKSWPLAAGGLGFVGVRPWKSLPTWTFLPKPRLDPSVSGDHTRPRSWNSHMKEPDCPSSLRMIERYTHLKDSSGALRRRLLTTLQLMTLVKQRFASYRLEIGGPNWASIGCGFIRCPGAPRIRHNWRTEVLMSRH